MSFRSKRSHIRGHPSKTSDQKLTFLPPPVQHRPFGRHHPPSPHFGRPDRIQRKNVETQNILRSGPKIILRSTGGVGVSDFNTDFNTDYRKTTKKILWPNFYFLDVRFMAAPPLPVRGRPLWPTPPFDQTSLMDSP